MTNIVELSKEWTTHAWLCELHIKRRIAKGWRVVRKGTVEHGCDDCHWAASAAYRKGT